MAGEMNIIIRETKGYCFWCCNLRPRNRFGVCEACWNKREDTLWEEDEVLSQPFYDRTARYDLPPSAEEFWRKHDPRLEASFAPDVLQKATTWWTENCDRLNMRVNRDQARLAAQALREAVLRYGEGILRVTHETHGLSPQALAQVRFFTANQDFRQPPANQFTRYLEDPSRFQAEEIAADPVGFLGFMGFVRLSQSEKRVDYARNAAQFLLSRGINAYGISAYFHHDAARIRDALIAEPNMGYGMKKANMFLRDMFVWGVWTNLTNLEAIDVASDRNTMKVALRARILETDIPLLSSFLDIFCYQYTHIDEMSAAAWRAVWEEWRALDARTAPSSPCLMDFIIYRIGREYCKQMVGHYHCQSGDHDFYHFGSHLDTRNCLVCHAQRPRRRNIATLTDYILPCQIPHDRLPRDGEGNLLLDSNNLLYAFGGICPFESACRPRADDFKAVAPPRSISVKGQTGWTSAYADRDEGGGGLMS
jgi:hypothetical protein